jgi:mono/diheme cytochrome c family protein
LRSLRFRHVVGALAITGLLGLLVFWVVTIPRSLTADQLPKHAVDLANGEKLYHASGCISCHKPVEGLAGVDPKIPAGGTPFKTPIGVFYPPNLTPDTETGLGQWSDVEFVNAMQRGIGRSGQHLIPAFPYTSYAHMKTEDVLDIKAYLATLPPVKNEARAPDVLALPLVRRGMGAWKWIGLSDGKFADDPQQSASWNRGAYLVNGPGHCAECHTPRTVFMTSDLTRFLAGGPHPEGVGSVPNLRNLVDRKRYKDAADLVLALQNGELLGYDKLSSGGMGSVQSNLARLPKEELDAIAEYLVSLK